MPGDAKRPDPEVVAEVKALLDEFEATQARRRTKGDRASYRFCFDVPEEWATLAGWLAFKAHMDEAGRPGKLPRPVHLQRESDGYKLADWHRTRRLLELLIMRGLWAERQRLEDGTHPWLFPETPEEKRARIALDDDIPF